MEQRFVAQYQYIIIPGFHVDVGIFMVVNHLLYAICDQFSVCGHIFVYHNLAIMYSLFQAFVNHVLTYCNLGTVHAL